jgi:hypothetical protein
MQGRDGGMEGYRRSGSDRWHKQAVWEAERERRGGEKNIAVVCRCWMRGVRDVSGMHGTSE